MPPPEFTPLASLLSMAQEDENEAVIDLVVAALEKSTSWRTNRMTALEAVAVALKELGTNAPPEKVASLIQNHFGINVEPKHIFLYRATILAQQQSGKPRQEAQRIAEQEKEKPGGAVDLVLSVGIPEIGG